jgi:nicotinate-nucleotide adenylyltransferase
MGRVVRLGIFGGTFDPPHIGHLILASEALIQFQLDRVLWVLTLKPPHKHSQVISSLQDRLDMVKAAIAENPGFELSRIDIDRPAPHYAVDTVRLLGEENPEAELIYLMGGDSLENLLTWVRPTEFVGGCHTLGVMCRPGNHIDLIGLKTQIPGITHKIRFFDAPLVDVSASQIRDRIRAGHPFQDDVHPAVYKLIEERQLYR